MFLCYTMLCRKMEKNTSADWKNWKKEKKKENPKKTKTEKFSVIFFVKIDRDFLKFEIIRDTQKIFSFHHSSKISL